MSTADQPVPDAGGLRLTDAEWREFQQIPDQGFSHRAWINARIAERARLAAALPAPVGEGVPTARLCSQCGELEAAMVKVGTPDGWCTICLDEAAEPTEIPDGDALRRHREDWASWLENWQGAIGPEPPTVDAVIRWLRADTLPFGCVAPDLGGMPAHRTHVAEQIRAAGFVKP